MITLVPERASDRMSDPCSVWGKNPKMSSVGQQRHLLSVCWVTMGLIIRESRPTDTAERTGRFRPLAVNAPPC
jgi:hypothetical protein